MKLRWEPDVNGSGGPTSLQVDTLPVQSVVQADGSTLPTESDIIAGRLLDLWYDGTAFRLQAPSYSGGVGGLSDRKVMRLEDEFPFSQSGQGQLGWSGGMAAPGDANHPGNLRISGTAATLSLNGGNTGWLPNLGGTSPLSRWDLVVVVKTDDIAGSIAQTSYEVGFKDSNTYRSGNSIALRYDSSPQACSSGNDTSGHWMLEVFSGGASTCVDTGLAVVQASWYSIHIWSASMGTVNAQVAAGPGAYSPVVTASSHVPIVQTWPSFLVLATGASRNLSVDYFEFVAIGLQR
jgi:hypothetical protein